MILPSHPSDETIKATLASYGLYRVDINCGTMYDSLYVLMHEVVEDIENERGR